MDEFHTMAYLDTELLRPSEIASYLGVSRSWVYGAAKAGRIPCVRLGGDDGPLRFVPSDVERWLESARQHWLPGGSTALAEKRAAETTRDADPQLTLDGIDHEPSGGKVKR
jgi:excisionase family DNA binding protein